MEQLRLLRAISRHRHAGWPEIASRLSKTTEECKAVFESVAQQPPDLTRMDLAALKQLENRIYQEKSHELMVALADLEGQYCTLTQISSVPEPMEPTTPVIHPIQQDELMDIDISSSALQANSSSTILSTEANSIATAEAPITEITTPSAPVRTMKHPSPKKRGAKGKAAGKAAAAKPTVLDSPGKRSDFGAITDTDNDSGTSKLTQTLAPNERNKGCMINGKGQQ